MKIEVAPSWFNDGTNHVLRVDQALVPGTTDGAALGTSALNWSDLFLDSGAVINFDGGDVTLTHAANLLTLGGGNLDLGSNTLLNVGNSGNDWSANQLDAVNNANAGGQNILRVVNTSTDASSDAVIITQTPATNNAGVDPAYRMTIDAVVDWSMGVDNSNSDVLTIGPSNDLGANDALRITNATPPEISFNAAQGADFDYVCDQCGRHEAFIFACCGKVEWHDDVLALRRVSVGTPGAIEHMARLGVFDLTQSGNEITPWMGIKIVPAQWYSWASIWQNRQRMDAQYEELNRRLAAVEA